MVISKENLVEKSKQYTKGILPYLFILTILFFLMAFFGISPWFDANFSLVRRLVYALVLVASMWFTGWIFPSLYGKYAKKMSYIVGTGTILAGLITLVVFMANPAIIALLIFSLIIMLIGFFIIFGARYFP